MDKLETSSLAPLKSPSFYFMLYYKNCDLYLSKKIFRTTLLVVNATSVYGELLTLFLLMMMLLREIPNDVNYTECNILM